MHIMKSEKPDRLSSSMPIDSNSIVSFATSQGSEICILYKNGILQIRDIERDGQVVCEFNDVGEKGVSEVQICW
jgi:hypothetical protein